MNSESTRREQVVRAVAYSALNIFSASGVLAMARPMHM